VKRTTLVIDAVSVILKQLDGAPDGPEVRALRARALDCVNEAVALRDTRPRLPAEQRDALMKKLLALHVEVRRLRTGQ
jgi:hypothetical protein